MRTLYASDRAFTVWTYTVSRTRLLLRSTGGAGHDTRIDVMFAGVEQLLLAPAYQGLTIGEADDAEVAAHRARHGDLGGTLYLLGDGLDSFVVAGFVQWHEDVRGPHDRSFFGHFPGSS